MNEVDGDMVEYISHVPCGHTLHYLYSAIESQKQTIFFIFVAAAISVDIYINSLIYLSGLADLHHTSYMSGVT